MCCIKLFGFFIVVLLDSSDTALVFSQTPYMLILGQGKLVESEISKKKRKKNLTVA